MNKHFHFSQEVTGATIDALEHWGPAAQMTQAMAECGELIAAIGWWHQGRSKAHAAVLAEWGDVYLMLAQVGLQYTPEELDAAIATSLGRLTSKIAAQKEAGTNEGG